MFNLPYENEILNSRIFPLKRSIVIVNLRTLWHFILQSKEMGLYFGTNKFGWSDSLWYIGSIIYYLIFKFTFNINNLKNMFLSASGNLKKLIVLLHS